MPRAIVDSNPANVAFRPTHDPPPPEIRVGHPRTIAPDDRPRVRGRFLFLGEQKLFVRGVTYGPFRPGPGGEPYPAPDEIERDFRQMVGNGINAIRTYTVPPPRLLDAAQEHGLHVMVGLAWEQHVAVLEDRARAHSVENAVREQVRRCRRHPSILCYTIGNEIPSPVVRWQGRRRTERFLRRLFRAAKEEDPDALFTYVNYPTTEYLHLPFLDLVCFNVYLEQEPAFRDYLARLHHVAGDRPLLLGELGLDSLRHGEQSQASSLAWQVRATFESGGAGAFVFAWTDEWHRGGQEVEDWAFGLVDRKRRPRPSLSAVRRAFEQVPLVDRGLPRITVVICSRNGSRTIRDCLEGLRRLDYPDVEVIVVDDGSRDGTAAIAAEYDVTIVSTPGVGLGAARNLGLAAATSEIVAYIDDDAYPDSHWLQYLAHAFLSTSHAAVGGPNITPPEDGLVAACVSSSPGGPIHVLLTHSEAEHIPGCNMAFRRHALEEIGGFDPRFRTAGDDVDICWRLQDRGRTIGFSPAAVVWHHRRRSILAYWRQQREYGKAEATLEKKWPERYNGLGHVTWTGGLYGNGHGSGWGRRRIYHGVWGSAPFQSIYQPYPDRVWSIVTMPEWYLGILGLAGLAALGALWRPLLIAAPLAVLALAAAFSRSVWTGLRASFPRAPNARHRWFGMRILTMMLHLAQPIARLRGRTSLGLTPWRRRRPVGYALPLVRSMTMWSERWREHIAWISRLHDGLQRRGAVLLRGGAYDRWDLEVRYGILGSARFRTAVEEHGQGRQLIRVRAWPRIAPSARVLAGSLALLSLGASTDGAERVGVLLLILAALVLCLSLLDASASLWGVRQSVEELARDGSSLGDG